ncbi:tail fiber protein [Bradyrhizobium sp. HKCCYLRH3099]|uniref:tail fiber protein n=1 Tax=Bradyrhizobium sp. HKCCYLRH3099 TaxID=3420762 RepID=UPI003EBD7B78
MVGVWDTPVNNNMTLLDLIAGGITTINVAAGSVNLVSAQYQCKTITFASTLISSITVTFPTSFKKSYEIQNQATGSSAYTITLQTTAGAQAICVPPGETVDVFNDGASIKFKNLGRVGSYWDYAGSSVPNWVSGCSVPPYLNCDGSTFSAATYPALAAVLGSTTLPDARGRARYALDQGTGRVTSGSGGVNGSTIFTGGGFDSVTLGTSQLPSHNHGVNDPGHGHNITSNLSGTGNSKSVIEGAGGGSGTIGGGGAFGPPATWSIANNGTGISIQNTGSGSAHTNMPPVLIAGLTLIRAG